MQFNDHLAYFVAATQRAYNEVSDVVRAELFAATSREEQQAAVKRKRLLLAERVQALPELNTVWDGLTYPYEKKESIRDVLGIIDRAFATLNLVVSRGYQIPADAQT